MIWGRICQWQEDEDSISRFGPSDSLGLRYRFFARAKGFGLNADDFEAQYPELCRQLTESPGEESSTSSDFGECMDDYHLGLVIGDPTIKPNIYTPMLSGTGETQMCELSSDLRPYEPTNAKPLDGNSEVALSRDQDLVNTG